MTPDGAGRAGDPDEPALAEPAGAESGASAGTYELLRTRLLGQADELARRADALNVARTEAFGSSRFEVIGTTRIRTDNNSTPRDIAAVGDSLLFGYNVFIGLKSETSVDDVFSLHHLEAGDDGAAGPALSAAELETWLYDPGFVADFRELHTYYKEARLLHVQRREGRLLAVFQTGGSLDDLKVFRWSVDPEGRVSYIDNRGEREYVAPPQFDFEWQPITREHHVSGRRPHVNVVDKVFVDPTKGTLEIRLEDNTAEGEVVLVEPVDDPDQAVADTAMAFAVTGDLVLLRVRPYQETAERGYVVNTFTRTARRNDAVLSSCRQLPEDHGIITPKGYELRTGETRDFDLPADGMAFETVRRSPNGEDVLYVFHEQVAGLSILLPYNLIRREIGQPIVAHGYSVFDDGTLMIFREDAEPTRVHPMQFWATPFVSDEHHAREPVGDDLLHRIGNADLVRGMSEALNIARQAREAEPSVPVYADLVVAARRVLDAHFWLGEDELGDLATALHDLQSTSELIIDEFEKVQTLRSAAADVLVEVTEEVAELHRVLRDRPPADADEHVDTLRVLRRRRGHLITVRDVRHIDQRAIDALEVEIGELFDAASARAAAFFAEPGSFSGFASSLEALEREIESTTKTAEAEELQTRVAEFAEGLDVLTQVVGSLEIADTSVRTGILERVAEVMGTLNRTRAVGENRRRELATAENTAAFSVEFALFAQSLSAELARATTPELCDEGLGRLLLILEDLESRYAEFDDELERIGAKREEVYETLSSRKQGLLDERQRQAQRLVEAADRILTSVARRVERFESADDLNAWFVADPMVTKVRSLADDLRELDQPVAADEVLGRLDRAREDAGRSLRDRADIYEAGGQVIRLGTHRFSVDTEPLELTAAVIDGRLHAVLTGTDFRQPLDHPDLVGSEAFWQQHLVSETAAFGRATHLAATLALDALAGTGDHDLDELLAARSGDEGLLPLVRSATETRLDEGHERGVHDHDAAKILDAILDRLPAAGLLRYSAGVRADALLSWGRGLDEARRAQWLARCRSLGRLRRQYRHSPAIAGVIEELTTELTDIGLCSDPATSAEYLFEELAEEVLEFDTSVDAMGLADAFRLHQAAGHRLANELAELDDDVVAERQLARAWFMAFATAESPELLPLVPEAAALVVAGDVPRMPAEAELDLTISGLLAPHPTVVGGELAIRLDELLTDIGRYQRIGAPGFRSYQRTRSQVLAEVRDTLRLSEFQPEVMSSFVRNQLIDKVYLPLIGDNFAKQLGSVDSGRTDQMGLLLLISPPGYGKTTLMEYVANRLGMVFVKVNGPALGLGVTSLDPAEAPDATAAQEVVKINFALEMGSNVLLYLDDIQHTNPELLQKFISMTDAQRRMEGVWRGRTRTYDLRGKRFAVVMAGNPYTESGERFAIPDMLANRADTWNLGDVLSGRDEVFALSYLENALASSPVLQPLTSRDLADVGVFVAMAQGRTAGPEDLSHDYSAAELDELLATFDRLLRVQEVLLAVNRTYIASASMADEYRTEPRFQLQGSYRNMARLAEKVLPVMTDAELEALLDDHYRGEAQTLTTGTEANLLKLGELRGTLDDEGRARWEAIRAAFRRRQLTGGDDEDPMNKVAGALADIGETLRSRGS